ncbi:MAG: hypothetical protein K5866_01865 [Treponema sp.]|nr:hypothetical protein [Treponema sp.]
MLNKKITPLRIVYFFSFIVLVCAVVMNLTTKIQFISIIPYTKYVEAFVNSLCAILCIVIIIKPDLLILQYFVLTVEATITTLIGFVGIGTMVLMFFILTLFANGAFKKNLKKKIIILVIWWLLVAAGLYKPFGIKPVLFLLALTCMYTAMFLAIYDRLKASLSYLFPDKEIAASNIKLPPYGSEIDLSDYGLTERQIKFLTTYLYKGKSYDQIARENFISLSVVKKEMAFCCKAFGVKNREALMILLLQYKIKK